MHTHLPDPFAVIAFLCFAVLAITTVLFVGTVIGMALGRLG